MALPMVGRFNVFNALAACAAALAVGVAPADLKHAIAGSSSVGSRCRMIDLPQGGMLVDDTYNSNPHAVDSVLRSFATLADNHYRWIILGDMLELGTDENAIHRALGEKLATYGFDRITLVGHLSEHTLRALQDRNPPSVTVEHFENATAAAAVLVDQTLPPNCRLWCKASRGIRLEQVVQALT